MLELDDPLVAKQQLSVEIITDGLWCLRRKPGFRKDWEHVSYAVQTESGLVLFDTPPVFNSAAVDAVSELGEPQALIISHKDFLSTAQLWKMRFRLSVAMGDDKPLPGSQVTVDKQVLSEIPIGERWTMRPQPGHTIGSIIMSGTNASGESILLAGDALAVWQHPDGRTQVSIMDERGNGSASLRKEMEKDYQYLCCCTGWLAEPAAALEALASAPKPNARPFLAEMGGVWGDADEDRWLVLLKN